MQRDERLTKVRMNGIKSGYWVDRKVKKDDVVQRLGQYEDTELSPEDIRVMKRTGNSEQEEFDSFLQDVKGALEDYKKNCLKLPGYTSKCCFVAETLAETAGDPDEQSFTASEIKKVLDLAKLK